MNLFKVKTLLCNVKDKVLVDIQVGVDTAFVGVLYYNGQAIKAIARDDVKDIVLDYLPHLTQIPGFAPQSKTIRVGQHRIVADVQTSEHEALYQLGGELHGREAVAAILVDKLNLTLLKNF